MTQVLAVKGLTVDFPAAEGERSGTRQVVAGIDFDIHAGRTLGVVGESGCGKTLSALAVMGLVPRPGRVGGSRALVCGDRARYRQHRVAQHGYIGAVGCGIGLDPAREPRRA